MDFINRKNCKIALLIFLLLVLSQCREEGAYALENAAKSREGVPIFSDLRSEATEEEGIGSTSRDEVAFLVCMHPPHGINIVIKKKNSDM